MATVEFVSSL